MQTLVQLDVAGLRLLMSVSVVSNRGHRWDADVQIKTSIQYLEQVAAGSIEECKRGGVIFYTMVDGEVVFMLGVDQAHDELTDFGGGKTDRNCIITALREMKEETLGIMNLIRTTDVRDSIVIHDHRTLIMFLRVAIHPTRISDAFARQYAKALDRRALRIKESVGQQLSRSRRIKIYRLPEVKAVVWLTWAQLYQASRGCHLQGLKPMFSRIARLIRSCPQLIRKL